MANVNNPLNSAPATSSTSAIYNWAASSKLNELETAKTRRVAQMSPTASSSNDPPQTSLGGLPTRMHTNSASSPNIAMQQPALSSDTDANEGQSSVKKIIHETMMSNQLGGGIMGINNGE
ncbi:uncharacterized protein LOC113774147 [Coffea eugenioides]|uniref:uncharacterized protein LOC113774147 n=1 Tax=Coffea eugenioides TaxID=49369 RepID=UPI000F60B239|nr:uncharacterized protein LOC113774147 [Coffea eugenioides]